MDKKKFLILDGTGYIFRAFYGVPPLTNSDGIPTNAALGFTRMLINILKEQKPGYFAVVFDVKGPTFRHKMYDEYKAHRPPPPPDLIPQFAIIKEIVAAFNIPIFEKTGYEADDIIGTLAREADEKDISTFLLTVDKDMMQLVNEKVKVLDEFKEITYGPEEVKNKFGLYPKSIVDYLALTGDASDNVPGVKGIGPKTAVLLLNQFDTLENLLDNIPLVKGAKKQENLTKHRDDAILSKKLVTIDRYVPVEFDLEKLKPLPPSIGSIKEIFSRLDFSRLLTSLDGVFKEESVPQKSSTYITVSEESVFASLLEKMKKAEFIVIDVETTSKEPTIARLVGVSVCVTAGTAYYIPLGHNTLLSPHPQLELKHVFSALKPILENPNIKKGGQNIKYDMIVLQRYGVDICGLSFDTMAASYLLNPNKRHNLEEIAAENLGHKMISYEDVTGKGKKQVTFDLVPIAKASEYSGEDSEVTFRLSCFFEPLLKKEKLLKRFDEIEIPLIPVLVAMERNGIKVNPSILNDMSEKIKKELTGLEKDIFSLAGEPFNIDSPKQLSHILFDKMGIKPIKKTKTGYSTNVDVLEKLSSQNVFPSKVLEYRVLRKLKSTYTDAIPLLINSKTKRVHTSFNQTVTATGRLSSSNPNLQNIPVRTEMGRNIRKAFEAEEGYVLMSFDYSQVELRVLAHFSEDARLVESFKNNKDVHAITASEIFSLDLEFVTSEMRRKAKVVNFGIIYGMGSYGLSRDLNISMHEAKEYITNYYAAYTGVEKFRDKIISEAESTGWVSTLLGHRRKVPELRAKNKNTRQAGERIAMNTPIQGTAAELIKLAMINIHNKIKGSGVRMLLQIHDELIFEVPEKDLEWAKVEIKKEMENVYPLNVPLVVNMSYGQNWAELKD